MTTTSKGPGCRDHIRCLAMKNVRIRDEFGRLGSLCDLSAHRLRRDPAVQ
jgi:hypothetical protein